LLTGNEDGIRLPMEFDIVELGNVNGRLRLSMEFDIVDNGVDKGVRLGRTSYSWSMEFDIVELRRKTKTERRAEENCWNKQGLRQFGYYPQWNSRTRWKFADRAERRKSLRQSSLYDNELYDVMHFSKYGIVANNYDGRSS